MAHAVEPTPPTETYGTPESQKTQNQPLQWGTAERTWSGKKTIMAAGVTLALAMSGGVAAISAANAGTATSAEQGLGGFARSGSADGTSSLASAAVHSEAVIQSGSTWITQSTQSGTVIAVSSTSITVKSADGYTRTYAVASTTKLTEGIAAQSGAAGAGTTGTGAGTAQSGTAQSGTMPSGAPGGTPPTGAPPAGAPAGGGTSAQGSASSTTAKTITMSAITVGKTVHVTAVKSGSAYKASAVVLQAS
jgi:hypothetical protein